MRNAARNFGAFGMAYDPLHHKYRPQTFAQLVGQEAIAATLTNAIASRRIAPAYLFTGPRGTGKTSSARILAKSLNCQSSPEPTADPCGQCDACRAIANGSALDIIEIDAASNTGVDNIRDLIERAQFAPVSCRYKVYVIDECHMLSTAAFNALLKTLEEPPDRVVFVLATTDPQRVLPTIISRCQRFDFRRIPLAAMAAHLQAIARQEQIEITDTALTLVAQIANGGLRDAESLLDQLSLLPPPIEPEAVWDLVGAVPERDLLALLQAIRSGDPETAIDRCRHLLDRGREPLAVLQSLANFYLHLLIAKTAPQRGDLIAVTSSTWEALCAEAGHWATPDILRGQQQLKASEGQLRHTTQPRLWLEVALLELLPVAASAPVAVAEAPAPRSTMAKPAAPVPAKPAPPLAESPAPVAPPPPETPPTASEPSEAETQSAADPEDTAAAERDRALQLWQQVLDNLQPRGTKALLSQQCCLLDFDSDQAVAYVGVKSPNLLKMANSKVSNIKAAFEKVLQRSVAVEVQVADPATAPMAYPTAPDSNRSRTPSAREASPAPTSAPREPEPEPEPEPAIAQRNGSPPTPAPPTPPVIDKPTAAPAAAVSVDPEPPPPVPDDAPVATSDLERVTQQFANHFKGEVIDLNLNFSAGEMAVEAELPLTELDTALESDDSDEDESDIPF